MTTPFIVTFKHEIGPKRLAELMTSAIEGGDPVTTASRGGWCDGINLIEQPLPKGLWYADEKIYAGDFVLEIIEVEEERPVKLKKHRIDRAAIQKGFEVMAEKYRGDFLEFIDDNEDAAIADIFLQCVVFGEEKYA